MQFTFKTLSNLPQHAFLWIKQFSSWLGKILKTDSTKIMPSERFSQFLALSSPWVWSVFQNAKFIAPWNLSYYGTFHGLIPQLYHPVCH